MRWAAALEVLLGAAKAWASAWQLDAALEVLWGVALDLETSGEASAAEPAAALAQESGGKSAEASGQAWDFASARRWRHRWTRRRHPAFAVFVLLRDAARRRLARGVVERVINLDVVVQAPAKVLVEGRGVSKHVFHVHDAVDRPITDVLVK